MMGRRGLLRSASPGLCVAILLLLLAPAGADVRLPHIFGSKMVLQADKPLPVWGWADPDEEVTVKFGDQAVTAKADAKGKWMLKLAAVKAGGPLQMSISGKNKIDLADVMVGEVWVCSGQSNMEMGMKAVEGGPQAMAAAKNPNIRVFWVPNRPSGLPENDVNAAWDTANPKSLENGEYAGFSATAYFFACALNKALNVPIGVIDTTWGGTRIEPWTPPVGFQSVEALKDIVKGIDQANEAYSRSITQTISAVEAWIPVARKAQETGDRVPPMPAFPTHPLSSAGLPTGLYNGMVHPIVPFAIRGALWYQGESNRGEGMLYAEKMKALIGGWRSVWGQGDFPFYFVQLAPFRYGDSNVVALPLIWEAQTASLSIPNTGMAVTTDLVDNIADIHPRLKAQVAERLSFWALAKIYGKADLVYMGPMYKSMAVEGNKVRLSFDHVGGGLASRDGKPLTFFEIAGADKKFVKAQATVDSDAVVVSSDEVKEPVAVRFAWHHEAMPNLQNKAGLPACPFRTDRW
jgi:sialate O-acetylesterase